MIVQILVALRDPVHPLAQQHQRGMRNPRRIAIIGQMRRDAFGELQTLIDALEQ